VAAQANKRAGRPCSPRCRRWARMRAAGAPFPLDEDQLRSIPMPIVDRKAFSLALTIYTHGWLRCYYGIASNLMLLCYDQHRVIDNRSMWDVFDADTLHRDAGGAFTGRDHGKRSGSGAQVEHAPPGCCPIAGEDLGEQPGVVLWRVHARRA